MTHEGDVLDVAAEFERFAESIRQLLCEAPDRVLFRIATHRDPSPTARLARGSPRENCNALVDNAIPTALARMPAVQGKVTP
jgi:hypothetical protein